MADEALFCSLATDDRWLVVGAASALRTEGEADEDEDEAFVAAFLLSR